MPLTADNVIRQNSGGVAAATNGTVITVSLAAGETTDAGSVVVIFFLSGPRQFFDGNSPPAGWEGAGALEGMITTIYRTPELGLVAGESSWNLTITSTITTTTEPLTWIILELTGMEPTSWIEEKNNGNNVAKITTGTTISVSSGLTATYDGLALAVYGSLNDTSTTPDDITGHTGGFTEIVQSGQAGTGSTSVALSASVCSVNQITTYSTAATFSRTLTTTGWGQVRFLILNAANARHAANLFYMDGAEHGTVVGNTIAVNSNNAILNTVAGGVSVSATAKRSGNYGWLFVSTAAACNCTVNNALNVQLLATPVVRRCFRFPTLPAVDVEMWVLSAAASPSAVLIVFRYIAATGKIGLKVGAGTEIVSDQAITANQWFAIDARLSLSSVPVVSWQLDYNAELTNTAPSVVQGNATGGTGAVGFLSSVGGQRIGWTNAITATMHTDDACAGADPMAYPLGDIQILPLKVDPAGTVTVSGSTANFGVMTANGTVGAFNATNARNAVDDVPPDLSATRDAVVVVTASADYVEFPVENYDLAANAAGVRGVRFIACLWAASATAATIGLRVWDGSTLWIINNNADPNADSSATPSWAAGIVRPTTNSSRMDWNQSKITALALRMDSGDATPDIGIDNFVFEIAVTKAKPEVLFGEPGGVYVEARRDPDSLGLVGFTVTTPAGQAVTVDYEINGTPFSTGVIAAGTTAQYVPTVSDAEFPTVNSITLKPS